jgi:ATP-dependent RNA helicase DDX41
VYLLECIQKTALQVVSFSEQKSDVDEIHEYQLIKVVGEHTWRQGPRSEAIRLYKKSKKGVLVATDIAAKSLNFPNIQLCNQFRLAFKN